MVATAAELEGRDTKGGARAKTASALSGRKGGRRRRDLGNGGDDGGEYVVA